MKKILVILTTFILLTTFVFAQGAKDTTGPNHEEMIEAGGQNGTGVMASNEMMQGVLEKVQERVKEGNFMGPNGEQIQIELKENNRIQLRVQNISIHSGLNITQDQNRTRLNVQLGNGRNAELKIMPETASETALSRLRLKNCNQTNNCTIELKEVGAGEQTRLAYELQTERKAKFLGLFGTQMKVQAQVDAENGEIISTSKPWWAFLASEQ